jgi:sugar phosphate isomerase/epimerase
MFFDDRDVPGAVTAIAGAGYDSAEVWIEQMWRKKDDPADVAAAAAEVGIGLTVHAPFYDLNILSINEGIRAESRRQVTLALEQAVSIGADVVVVHPGKFSSSRDTEEEAWERLAACMAELDASAGPVTVAVEMMEKKHREFFMTPADAARLMDLGLPSIRLTVDIAHLGTLGDAGALLRELDPAWIAHVHLSQGADGRTHAPLGPGLVDLPVVLATLSRFYNGVVSLEGFDTARGGDLAVQNRKYLRELGY